MKTTISIAALSFLAATMTFAADVSGKWKSEFDSQVGHQKYVYDLKADGDTLSGKATREVEGQKTETELKEFKLSDSDISFIEPLKFNDQELRIEYKGKVAGDEMRLTRKVGDFATTEIVAKREKASDSKPDATSTSASSASKLTLKVVKVDNEETNGEDGKGANAVDGKPETIWHTQWQDDAPAHPHQITIELSAAARIRGFTYLPRQDFDGDNPQLNGTIREYEFYVSDDGKDFGKPVAKGTFTEGRNKKTVTFDAKQCRFIQLKALSEINDQVWTSAAEIGVIQE